MLNIAKDIRRNLPAEIQNILKKIGSIADASNFKAYIVGGFVRDLLLGVKNLDVDIAAEPNAIALAQIFAKKFKCQAVFHKRFGTATVMLPSGLKLDFATARTEYYEHPAALPVVEFASIKEDLTRRDFTINAMAARLNRKEFGELMDFHSGLTDLREKKIRVLHDLSFVEDPTRVFRAVRFEQRYHFKIEPHTEHLINTAAGLGMLSKTGKQRIRDEIILLLKEPDPLNCVIRMSELHELRFLHPKINFTKETARLFSSIKKACAWYKTSYPRKRQIDLWLIYLFAILDTLSEKETEEFVRNFVFRKGEELRIMSVKQKVSAALRVLKKTSIAPHAVYQALEPLSFEAILYAMAKSSGKTAYRHMSCFFGKYNSMRLAITGKDIKAAGFKPGPYFRGILEKTLYAKIDGKLHGREEELTYALKVARS
ncbi:MAG: CCA tRNA nucleotidyltransferase [Candidatus Omnitrophota bacterium]